jgi:uncharacterized membrane protein
MTQKCCRNEEKRKGIIKKGAGRIRTLVAFIITALVIVIGMSPFVFGEKGSYEPSKAVQSSKDVVKIPLVQVNGGTAQFFHYTVQGKDIRFFVLKSSDGVIRAAFDACDICYKARRGYRQEGDFMICNNCRNRFPSVNINVIRGGCNPVPLERTVSGNTLIIKVLDILKGESYFS